MKQLISGQHDPSTKTSFTVNQFCYRNNHKFVTLFEFEPSKRTTAGYRFGVVSESSSESHSARLLVERWCIFALTFASPSFTKQFCASSRGNCGLYSTGELAFISHRREAGLH